jgi:Na+-transporting NADH:ubiquinone oxidoreductase subunit NqrC
VQIARKLYVLCVKKKSSVIQAIVLASFGLWFLLFLFLMLKREDYLVAILGSYFGFVVNVLVYNFVM